MEKLLVLVISGVASGMIYSMVAAGLTLSYSATGILNLSYGAVAYCSAYVYFQLRVGIGWTTVPSACIVVLVFAPLLALLLDALVFRRLAHANDFVKLIAMVGLLVALPALTRLLFDTSVNMFHADLPKSLDVAQVGLPPGLGPAPKDTWLLFGSAPFDSNQLIAMIVASLSAASLWFFMRRTRLGLQMRAVVDRPDFAGTRGVSLRQTSRTAALIGTVLAAIAGIVAAPILGAIDQTAFMGLVFIAVAAAVLGGLRSIPLAFAGGIFLGLVQNLTVGYLSFASEIRGFYEGVPFAVLLLVLLVVGKNRRRVAGWAAEGALPPIYLTKMPQWRRSIPWILALLALLVYTFVLANHYWQNLVATGLAVSLILLSYSVVLGLGGLVSLAQAAFVSVGGMTAGLLMTKFGWPFLPALLGAVLVAIALGVLVALPALRLGGLYLALATLALGLLADNILFQWAWFSNNTLGWTVTLPKFAGVDFATTENVKPIAALLLALVGLTVWMVHNLQRSTSGRRLDAVRSSEAAAATSGISPTRSKLVIFAVSAAIAAVGGVFYAALQGSASGTTAPTGVGLLWLAAVVLFGVRRPGPLVAAGVLMTVFPAVLANGIHVYWWHPVLWFGWSGTTSLEIPAILFGLGAIGLARHPDGVVSQFGLIGYRRWLRRKTRRESASDSSVLADFVSAEAGEIETEVEQRREYLADVNRGSMDSDFGNRITDAAVVIDSLHAGYEELEVLHGIDLALRRGEIVALFGANGSGKSTLAGTLSGVVKAMGGKINYEGEDLIGVPDYRRARNGLVVMPESRGIFPGLTVEENLTLVLPDRSQRAQAVERFPILEKRRDLLAENLSGGEQQMLALAPFLARPPAVLVVDEPTLGLAPLVVAEIMTVFAELRDRGVAVLLIEERTSSVLPVADWVSILELGQIVWQGPASHVDQERLAEAYLGVARRGDLSIATPPPTHLPAS